VIDEDGSEAASALWDAPGTVASSILAYPEGRAALASARRGGRLTSSGLTRALSDFEEVQQELVLVGMDEALAREAGELADSLALRGYDAVHLASALALGDGEVALITWDSDLGAAAERMGLATRR
jgi:predicted nucleic acid-binding protein